ncbi:MAG: hypothetical protein E7273_14585 [Pseudobutyrivibrio ruminis]|nr:hypothetical protein [Pseudobutyrivibrio ruminis]
MKKRLDKELIISLAIVALLVAVGVVFFLLFMFDIQISQNNIAGIVGSYSGISGGVWLFLLCRNC